MTLPPPKRAAQQAADSSEFDGGTFTFQAATKEQTKARVALMGVSGSGKTWTGLAVCHGLAAGGRFAVIDTERGAAAKYVGINGITFDALQMHRYDPRDLVKALAAAAKAGYPVVMVDSLSHFWKGTDGTLDQVEKAKRKYGGNSFAGWKDGTPMQNDMVDALLTYPGHVVTTMRSYTEWSLEKNERGVLEPVRKGTRPEQRRGVEYEFDLVASMDVENRLTVIKSRCPALHRRVVETPDGTAVAKELLAWLDDGAPAADPAAYVDRATAEDASYAGLLELYREVEARGLLATPMLHPDTDEPTSLGEYVKARGSALKVGER
ncbi:AAA family ATPase [Streptomyces aidingensis]|uniref:AAA domain-containing protein n=1 Tax=Streptomyces aidingensis TaxID=910347 RepID=A0A1I1PT40_9ACTN|nr:AAA family ATPase [Streptomyces aidingensis]SFD12847.1 AAA domain-containing protein [Streptomyces aidingensis]